MSRRIKVDMTGVESYTRCPEGEWLAKLKKIEEVEIQGSGDDGLKAQFEVIKGAAKGSSVFETFSLTEKALWKLKSFLDAIGVKSSGRLSIDLDKLEGKVCIVDVIHDEYNGQKRAKISAYIKPGDSGADEDDDEDELDDETDDDEDDEPKKPAKKAPSKKPASKSSKKRPEPEEDEDEDDLDDDEDDEEPEPPKKSKKTPAKKPDTKKPTPKKKAKPEPEDEDDDEDDWEEDED